MTGDSDAARARETLCTWLMTRGIEVVDVVETHLSVLAFGNDDVYKIKKPVRFPFCDFRTLDARRRNAEDEVALNRRLAPDVYTGVLEVTDAAGDVVDVVVQMRRLADAHRLSVLLAAGGGNECATAVARLIALFHNTCGRVVDGSAHSIAELWTESLVQCKEERVFEGSTGSLDVIEFLASRYLDGRRELLDARDHAGRVVDGHGDLLADDIYCEADGPRVIDCLEFDRRFRIGDTLLDIAFLVMDLESKGRPDLADRLLAEYRDASGDHWPDSLVHHYIAYRALVRAKVAALRADQGDSAARARAQLHMAQCERHLRLGRVRLVLLGGLPGTGKSAIASLLASRRGLVHLRSDSVRRSITTADPSAERDEGFGRGRYTLDRRALVYDTLLDLASTHLRGGTSVVLDAAWSDSEFRARARTLAAACGADLVEIECGAPAPLCRARIEARLAAHRDPSEATVAVHDAMAAAFDPWPEASTLVNEGTIEDAVAAAVRAFDDAAIAPSN